MSRQLHQMGGSLIQNKNSRDRKGSIRALKNTVGRAIEHSAHYHVLLELSGGSPISLINALFSFLYHKDPVIKWNAVTAMGKAVSTLAETDMESARNIIRRLMWNLNDESGGIGWGSAEAMGEILVRNSRLAREYAPVLLSYTMEEGNFQEHPLMQRGVLWGIGRLYEEAPEMAVTSAVEYILPFLKSVDPFVRGYAAWIMGSLKAEIAKAVLEEMIADESPVQIFYKENLIETSVKGLAEKALTSIKTGVDTRSHL
jgi:hypothetical protein